MNDTSRDAAHLPYVVDVCGLHYNRFAWDAYLRGFAVDAPDYLRRFGARFCAIAGADANVFFERLKEGPGSAVDYLVDSGGLDHNFDSYVKDIQRQGISHVVLHGCPWRAQEVNDYIAQCAAKNDDLFSAWAGVTVRDVDFSVRELERCIVKLGMRGATLIPCLEGIPASDRAWHPIYRKLCELDVPVWIHAGHNFNSREPLDISHWRHIDAVAAAFPELRILVGHGGWPWISEIILLCLRHDNVYLEFSSHRPASMSKAGSGWEPLLYHARGAMKDRVLFGTAAWMSPKTAAELAKEVLALPIPKESALAWLGQNAARVLGLRRPELAKA